ncbi:probable serine/threonine-protein kinase PBL8 [Arabidopsis lyrata subsp. lyrata]|uniref:probable serine/threonine-protein kinase PBL8 n=1 Tax=Arabidopsis lyrata subsp. lyrata TaxID=81972 RepID=UPI000A29AF5C|nr:probable serine/threonine-protein kinase PBL8 [Arabidopsis lyrata subsp. lyrata]|eukprot:XP_020879564.1 probable serine/threonine-protein kinase PBL8 [Arabidopsis lyrata subsp. lyrata]
MIAMGGMQEFNARVSCFRLKMVDSLEDCSHTPSYADGSSRIYYAPLEYIFSGISHMAGDVYSFGVILLEILTGLRNPCIILAKQATQNGKENIAEMIDPDLENSYPLAAGKLMCELSKQCLEDNPKIRPTMQEVLDNLNAIGQI